jgi:hypothetical protein
MGTYGSAHEFDYCDNKYDEDIGILWIRIGAVNDLVSFLEGVKRK